MFIDENFEVAVRPGTPTTGADAALNSAPIKTANPFTDVEPDDEAVVVAEPVVATAPCEAPNLVSEEDKAYTPSQPTFTANTENEEETEEDEAESNAAESEVTSEAVESVSAYDEVQSYQVLDELLPGITPPEDGAKRDDQNAVVVADTGEMAKPEDALISARNRDGMAKLNASPRHRAKTERIQKLVAGFRVNRGETSEILSLMHPYLIALGIWQFWCEEVVGIPVKTADAWRKGHAALQSVPPELLAAVSDTGVDTSKPKVTKLLLRLADEFYEGEVTEARIAEMVELVKKAAKREPSKPTAAATGSGPTVPLTTVHPTGSVAVTARRDTRRRDTGPAAQTSEG